MISVGFLNKKISSISFHKIKTLLPKLIKEENRIVGDISIVICTDEELKEMNIQHLNHDYFTDIITFDFTTGNRISGELYISYDRVSDNASTYSVSAQEEYTRVCFHGVLHLLGTQKIRSSCGLKRIIIYLRCFT
jgi:probable rRNA maturation factor